MDLADRTYLSEFVVDLDKQMGPNFGSGNEFKDLERALEKVADAIKNKPTIERSVEKVADAIKNKR